MTNSDEFSNCAWGGDRPKNTRWLSTPTVYRALTKQCPGDHVHEPYTVTRRGDRSLHFSTPEEAEYPWQLTKKVVELVAKFLRYILRVFHKTLQKQCPWLRGTS